MNASEIRIKYAMELNVKDAMRRWQFLLKDGPKIVGYDWFENVDRNKMLQWAKSTGKSWKTGLIRDADNNHKTIAKIKNDGHPELSSEWQKATSAASQSSKPSSKTTSGSSIAGKRNAFDEAKKVLKSQAPSLLKMMNAKFKRANLKCHFEFYPSFEVYFSDGYFVSIHLVDWDGTEDARRILNGINGMSYKDVVYRYESNPKIFISKSWRPESNYSHGGDFLARHPEASAT